MGARLSELLRKRLYDLYAAYAAGRIDEVLREYDDNVTMTSHAPVDIFPYLGRKQGKTAVEVVAASPTKDFDAKFGKGMKAEQFVEIAYTGMLRHYAKA